MALFLTGCESFIGRALLEQCRARKIDVTGIDSIKPQDPKFHQGDIRDLNVADLIPEGATVVHLAAISRDGDCRNDPRLAFDINVNGTVNLAAAARKRKCAQFIFASSEWVYGEVRNDEVQVETSSIDITKMKSEYALTKIIGEQCLRLLVPLTAVTVLRFGIVYGTRGSNWSAVESVFNAVRTRSEIEVGSVSTARRFIHVEDIARGILESCGRSGFEIFNLSGNRSISLDEVISTSCEILGRKVVVKETNASRPSIRNPDNALAKARMQWSPTIDLRSGLEALNAFLGRTA